MTREESRLVQADLTARRRLGRLGGLLLAIGTGAALPAATFLEPAPSPFEYLIVVAGVAVGLAFMAVPWERLPERAVYAIPIASTGMVLIGTSFYSDDFAFYQVLIGVYTAYAVDDRRDFHLLTALYVLATLVPLAYVDEAFDDSAHHILVTLPVLVIATAVVRYLREMLSQREREYHRFAAEAVALAERIRGGPVREEAVTPEDVERRLAELTSETRI